MKIEVTLETVTPLFLAGADPRGQPELRAASVRGALRFWLRALLGGVIGDTPDKLDDLRKAESAVFGSTDTNIGASVVVVRVQHGSLQTQTFSQLTANKMGVSYLFFAARKTNQEAERSAITAGNSFELTLSERAGTGALGETALRQAYAALWLLTHLGGLGARSRRGGGSLQATKATGEPNGLPSLSVRATSPAALQTKLKDGLTRLRQLVRTTSPVSVSNPSAFDVLHPNVCKVWVIDKSFNSWVEALNAIGQAMQQFRNRLKPDYSNVKAAVQGDVLKPPVRRAAFGLPIVFYYRSLHGRRGTLEGEAHDRRASPLLICVTKLSNGKCALVLTLFKAELLEQSERLKLQRSGQPAKTDVPDLSLIDEFLTQLDKDIATRLEVTGW